MSELNLRDRRVTEAIDQYWKTNVRIMVGLLLVWALAGLGCGVLWADWLNQWSISGIPLGFWFAQQGSIITFVFCILTYCLLLNRLDRRHHEQLRRLKAGGES